MRTGIAKHSVSQCNQYLRMQIKTPSIASFMAVKMKEELKLPIFMIIINKWFFVSSLHWWNNHGEYASSFESQQHQNKYKSVTQNICVLLREHIRKYWKKLALLTLTVQCNWMVNQKLDGLHVTLTYGDTITLLKMNECYVCRNWIN